MARLKLTLYAVVMGAAFSSTALAAPPRLEVLGNKVLSDYVYRAVAKLDDFDLLSPRLAQTVEERVNTFLLDSGYELARVAVRVRDGGLELVVDEGRLEKIVFPEQDVLRALGMKFALDLPHDIFNRSVLEQQFPRLEEQFGVTIERFEIREVKREPNKGLALSKITRIDEFLELPEPSVYELFIFASREVLPPGLDLAAEFQDPDGFTGWLMYRFRSAFWRDDRLEIIPEIGLRIQDVFQDGQGRRFLSRAGGSIRYMTPALTGWELRPFLRPKVLFVSRQRRDLDVRRFDFLEVEPIVGVSVPIFKNLTVGLGLGMQYRDLLELREGESPLPRADPFDEGRSLLDIDLKLRLGLSELRIDRRHRISMQGRYFSTFSERELFHGRLRYEKSYGIGYDEFRMRADADAVLGTVTFTDEVRVGDHLRGLFGDEFYAPIIGSLRLEYVFSIVREAFKLSVFHDFALFEGIDRTDGRRFTRFANSFGPGAHTVLFDTFRVSLYGAIGFMTEGGPTEAGVFLEVDQLF